MVSETDGRINDYEQIANRECWPDDFSIDDDRVEGTGGKTTDRSQPNELGLCRVEFEAVPLHPLTHTINALNESIVELLSITDEAMIVDL